MDVSYPRCRDEPFLINDPTLSLADKVIQWNFLNSHNHFLIACAALKNNIELARTVNVGIFIRLVGERTGAKYDNRTFIIERVTLFPREYSDGLAGRTKWTKGNTNPDDAEAHQAHSKIFVGYCMLPNGKLADTQLWILPVSSFKEHPSAKFRPPSIHHSCQPRCHPFPCSFWPLPRDISEFDLEAAEKPGEYAAYSFDHHLALSGLHGQGVIGIENEDGTRIPLLKRAQNGHMRWCAPGETDTSGPAVYKKHLVNPSRLVKKIWEDLKFWYEVQDKALATSEKRWPLKSRD
ncbi:hypothetical protein DFH07DRAFT_853027 [Mycena maculata]|uniref:Uncharacterized protein n=1 Tax=Mycena maculata TaxID=230809 RepID=A0AAD7MQB9_9AGAR|nr:hypothetical protein DFH07DRAFT_853027 [Mycena maculata]